MTWKELLAEKRIEPHATSKQELDALRSAVNRNLRDAAVGQLSADNRFGLAYEAGLLTAKMAVTCAGYRVKGQGAHQTTFAALKLALGTGINKIAAYLERCRRKRNELSYDAAGVVTETEAAEILRQAQALEKTVEQWIAKNHPQFS
jgi:NAD-dependent DNA ligase